LHFKSCNSIRQTPRTIDHWQNIFDRIGKCRQIVGTKWLDYIPRFFGLYNNETITYQMNVYIHVSLISSITSPMTWSKFSLFTFIYPCPLVFNEILWFVALSMYKWPLSDRKRGLIKLNCVEMYAFLFQMTITYIS